MKKKQSQPSRSPCTNLSDRVMDTIHNHRVTMRPKAYFVLGSVFFGIGLSGVLLIAVVGAMLAFSQLRAYGPFGYFWFGIFGYRAFLSVFPWEELLISAGAVIGGIMLLRKSELSYKCRALTIAIFLVSFVALLGIVIDEFGFKCAACQSGMVENYMNHHVIGEGWVTGEVIQMRGNEIEMQTPRMDRIWMFVTDDTLLPFGKHFEPGDKLRVVGRWEGSSFHADGIGMGGMNFLSPTTCGCPKR